MRRHTLLALALAFATPSFAMAQSTPAKPAPGKAAEASRHGEQKSAQPARTAQESRYTEVKGYVLPIAAGIASARACAGALYELATTQPLERWDARRTVELANQAVNLAHERAAMLGEMTTLSSDARGNAESAMNKLKDARSTVQRIQRQVGVIQGPMRPHEVANLRNLSAKLHGELNDAEHAVQKVADGYRVSLKLDVSERVPVSGYE